MNLPTASYDFAPLLPLLAIGALLAAVPVAWGWARRRSDRPGARQRALTLLTLFLTFDLVLFGAFTRLTDSGLGCPDWPGCYGHSSPAGASAAIATAQTAIPSGPVTPGKAWIEMIHRYLATGIGGLILLLAVSAWVTRGKRDDPAARRASPWWATATLAWVCLQGAFGAWTVSLKLYPAVVTAHLLGGLGLLALLAVQSQVPVRAPIAMPRSLRLAVFAVAGLCLVQVALGGWVSTNYAVLACTDFPTCQGSLWPPMDAARGFTVLRGLGVDGDGHWLPFAALTAIHYAHRLAAEGVLVALAALAWRLCRAPEAELRRAGMALAAIAVWQLLSGLANVLLGWPLAAALAHTGGAAALVTVLALLIVRTRPTPAAVSPLPRPRRTPSVAARRERLSQAP